MCLNNAGVNVLLIKSYLQCQKLQHYVTTWIDLFIGALVKLLEFLKITIWSIKHRDFVQWETMSRHENYNSQILPFIICLVYNNRQKKGTLNTSFCQDNIINWTVIWRQTKIRISRYLNYVALCSYTCIYKVHRQCLSLDPTPLKIPNAIYHIKRWRVFLLLIHCDIYITLSLSEYVAKWLCYINKHVFAHILSVMVHISISHCVHEAPRSFNVAYCFRRFAFRARMRSYE